MYNVWSLFALIVMSLSLPQNFNGCFVLSLQPGLASEVVKEQGTAHARVHHIVDLETRLAIPNEREM